MKKFAIIMAIILAVLTFAFPRYLGFSFWKLGEAVHVATGLGSKLACSAHFISGFDEQQSKADVVSYSAAAALLDLKYNEEKKYVTATLLGMSEKRSQYRPDLGCTLEIGDSAHLNQYSLNKITSQDKPWPLGNQVTSINKTMQSKAQSILDMDNEAGLQTRALLLVKDGKILAEAYSENVDVDTPLMGWSMGKSVTAMLIGRLDAMKGVDVNQTDLFEQWQQDERKNLNLEHLLTMSSGLDFDETYAPGSDATHMLFTAHSASDIALTSQLALTPSSHFSYSSGTTNILSRWLHEALGGNVKTTLDFVQDELFAPLNMAHTYFEPDASGIHVGSSYIYASGRDWARLAQLMVNKGEWNGQQLIKADWVQKSATPNVSDNEKRYGYQFWLNQGEEELRWPDLPADAYTMQGNRSQRVMMIPSNNIVIVRIGWTSGDYPMNENFASLLETLNN